MDRRIDQLEKMMLVIDMRTMKLLRKAETYLKRKMAKHTAPEPE